MEMLKVGMKKVMRRSNKSSRSSSRTKNAKKSKRRKMKKVRNSPKIMVRSYHSRKPLAVKTARRAVAVTGALREESDGGDDIVGRFQRQIRSHQMTRCLNVK